MPSLFCNNLHITSYKLLLTIVNCRCCKLNLLQNAHVANKTCCRLQIAAVANCTCCKLHMLQIARVANCTCCKLHVLQIANVAKWACCKGAETLCCQCAKVLRCQLQTRLRMHAYTDPPIDRWPSWAAAAAKTDYNSTFNALIGNTTQIEKNVVSSH